MSDDYTPPRYVAILDETKIALALGLKPEQVLKEFKDARVISRFSEYWAGRLYEYKKIENSNNESYDGIIEIRLLGHIHVSIKCLTQSGIKFQQSKYVGSGRTCDTKKLLASFKNVDFVIIIDITEFPVIKFVPITTKVLIQLVNTGLLTCSGYRKDAFYKQVFNSSSNEMIFEKFDLYK